MNRLQSRQISRQALKPATVPSPATLTLDVRHFRGGNDGPVDIRILRMPSDRYNMFVSISPQMDGLRGFVRGAYGDATFTRGTGERITDPRKMRCDILALTDHAEEAFASKRQSIAAVISFGDHLTNIEYIVAANRGGNREIYMTQQEMARVRTGRFYYALGADVDGTPYAGRVRFTIAEDGYHVYDIRGTDITNMLDVLFTGPPVIWEGKRVTAPASASHWIADIRHLMTLISVPIPGGTMLLAEAELMHDEHLLRKTVSGAAITLPLSWTDSDGAAQPFPNESVAGLIRDAQNRGYEQASSAQEVRYAGQFAIEDDKITLRLLPGRYPHNVLGVDGNNDWLDIQVTGISTKKGATLDELASITRRAGGEYVIALDQGADPQSLVRVGESYRYFPSFNHRARVSSAIVFTDR